MKRLIGIISLVLIMLLSACSNEKGETEQEAELSNQKENEIVEGNNPEEENDQEDNKEEVEEKQNTKSESDENESDSSTDEEPDQIVQKPQYELTENWNIVPLSEDVNDKVILLTIDDAPDAYAIDMAKTLKELEAKAIFFVNGHFLDTEEEKEALKQIHEMGFEIGNHTYNHQALPDVSEEKQKEEIVKLNDLVEEIIGERPKFFRAPHGQNTEFAQKLVEEEGMLLMNWTYGYDYFTPYMDAEKLTTAMVTGKGPEVDVPYSLLKPGANLLMHDREWTNDALADIVNGLRDQGFEMVDPTLIQIP